MRKSKRSYWTPVNTQKQNKARENWQPNHGSGKTRFNREKRPGESWTKKKRPSKE